MFYVTSVLKCKKRKRDEKVDSLEEQRKNIPISEYKSICIDKKWTLVRDIG